MSCTFCFDIAINLTAAYRAGEQRRFKAEKVDIAIAIERSKKPATAEI
jgi:hypothetical protein